MELPATPPHTPRAKPMLAPIVAMNSPQRLPWQPGAAMPVDGVLDSSEQLGQALDRGSTHDIHRVLDADPDAAWMPLHMSGMQTPLCAAIWLHCDLEVIQLLIARGAAKVSMVNSYGQGPLSVLASCQCTVFDGEQYSRWYNQDLKYERNFKEEKEMEEWTLSVAAMLLQAGCSTMDRDSSGRLPQQVALENGLPKLAFLIQQWADFKHCVMLRRTALRSRKEDHSDCFERLPFPLVCDLLEFVAAGNLADLLAPSLQW